MKKTSRTNFSRREFVKKSAFGVSGALLTPTILHSCVNSTSANSMVNVGHIGVGSRGWNELKDYFLHLESSHSIAISDVWEERRLK